MKRKVKRKTALITGITGQDGSYLAELLLKKGYIVHGMVRRSSVNNIYRINGHDIKKDNDLHLHYGDMTDSNTIYKLIDRIKPSELYNLAAQSHVGVSFDLPVYTMDVVGLGCTRILEAVRDMGLKTRFYQASSSEMFGKSPPPQDENSPFNPRSPYGIAKLMAHETTKKYREAYGIFACSGILFNHESPRRGEDFLSRKVTKGVANILAKKERYLYLGNLNAKRDWGYAPEYVKAMWMMLQKNTPEDYVIATGETHTVREFVEEAFGLVGLNWKKHIKENEEYFRPLEVDELMGDPFKANDRLGWKAKITFKELVKIMLKADLDEVGLDYNKFM